MRSQAAAVLLLSFTAAGQNTPADPLQKLRQELEANPRSSLIHYRIGDIYFKGHDYAGAANEFRAGLQGDLRPKWVAAALHTYLGRIFDATGQFERAANEYSLGKAKNAQSLVSDSLSLPADAYHAGKGIAAPAVVERTEPEYTEEARVAGLEGSVLLTGVVSEDGLARDVKVATPLGLGLDERAMEAVRLWRFHPGTMQDKPLPVFTTIPVNFTLPSKRSRWHLVRAEFHPPEGVSRPMFRSATYPTGPGISKDSMDHAAIVSAVGRQATVTLSFNIDEQGYPRDFYVENASDPLWGSEAIALVKDWRFIPGSQDGKPITVGCTLTLAWGRRDVDAARLAELTTVTDPLSIPPDAPPPSNSPTIVIQRKEPSYSEEALKAQVEGGVVLWVTIDEKGAPTNLRVLRALGFGLDEQAIEAVRQWRFKPFKPYALNGNPAPLSIGIEVEFRLPGKSPQ